MSLRRGRKGVDVVSDRAAIMSRKTSKEEREKSQREEEARSRVESSSRKRAETDLLFLGSREPLLHFPR